MDPALPDTGAGAPDSKVMVVCGPTASGKTAAAIALAETFGGEIISADSMQVYRYMDIGTAKPTASDLARVPHHLIDVAEPDAPFDARRFSRLARRAAAGIALRGRPPIVAGGTGLYIKAMLHGLFPAPSPAPALRRRLKNEVKTLGAAALHGRLEQLDPVSAARISAGDTHRVLRALEVLETTGRPLSELQQAHRFAEHPYRVMKIGLDVDRNRLYRRTDRRVDRMMEDGLVAEVQGLLNRGYAEDLKSMQSIGYRHVTAFLAGRLSWDETVRTLKRDTRRYAKRQMTWFRADPDIRWMDPEDLAAIARVAAAFLNPGGKTHDRR